MDTFLLILKNKQHGFERLTRRKLTIKSKIHGKKMKNHHIDDLMKSAKEIEEKDFKEGFSKVEPGLWKRHLISI